MVGTALVSITVLLLSSVLSSVTRQTVDLTKRNSSHQDLVEAQRFIRRLGRVSTVCNVVNVGSHKALECDVDFASPPSGKITKTRFIQDKDSLNYQHYNSASSRWETKTRYAPIQSFTLCDSAAIGAGTCTIPGKQFEVFANTATNRFFRYEILAEDSAKGEKGARFAGAFYVRNPTPFASSVVYQWSGF